jgi:hypothetical protein
MSDSIIAYLSKLDNRINVKMFDVVAIDAEWYWKYVKAAYRQDKKRTIELMPAHFSGVPITVSLAFSRTGESKPGLVVLFLRSDLPRREMTEIDGVPVMLVYVNDFDDGVLNHFDLPEYLRVLMFYAPQDVQYTIGTDQWRELLLSKKVSQKRRITVDKFKYHDCLIDIDDLVGIANSSLDDFLERAGIASPYKHLVKKENKGNMLNEAMTNPGYNEYCAGDVLYLYDALMKTTVMFNRLLTDAFPGFVEYTVEDLPRTMGKLVSTTFERVLMLRHPKLFAATLLATTSNSDKAYAQFDTRRSKFLAADGDVTMEALHKFITNKEELVHGLGSGSVRGYFPGNHGTGSVVYNAIVQGGRCVNEQPLLEDGITVRKLIKNVFDIDMSGAYGSALAKFDYPIGHPTVWYRKAEDPEHLTLKQFLHKYERNLGRLFTITVKGALNFHQDLIFSKLKLDENRISSKLMGGNFEQDDLESSHGYVSGGEINCSHLGGEFKLITKEIVLGIITPDILRAIRAISSNSELSGFMNLEVVAASWYPADKEVTIDEYIDIMACPNKRGRNATQKDTRTKFWCAFPMEDFVGSIIKTRSDYKERMKALGKETPEGHYYHLLQNSCKLFVNTTYGCLASPFFPMGNTVLANNITAKARLGVWMISKALNAVQSITDGGLYENDLVFFNHSGRKRSFESLYLKLRHLEFRRYIEVGRLFDDDIFDKIGDALVSKDTDRQKELAKFLDVTATKHINAFWEPYGLELPFAIEHKLENTGRSAVYDNSADYMIDTVGSTLVTRCRGVHDDNHPKIAGLWNALHPDLLREVEPDYKTRKRFSITEAIGKNKSYLDYGMMPGDDRLLNFTLRTKSPFERALPESVAAIEREAERVKKAAMRAKSHLN